MTNPSVWGLLGQWADWAAVRSMTMGGVISFRFTQSIIKSRFCEAIVSFPDVGFSEMSSLIESQLSILLLRTLRLNLLAGHGTRIYLETKGNSFSIDLIATYDKKNKKLNLNEVEGLGMGLIGEMTIQMALPFILKEFQKEGAGFVRHCGILKHELETDFKIELDLPKGPSPVTCDLPEVFLAGHSQIIDGLSTIRCGAYFQHFKEPSRTVVLNCVPRCHPFLKMLKLYRPNRSWRSLIREYDSEIASITPNIASKNILLFIRVDGENEREGGGEGKGKKEEWKGPTASKIEYCVYNAMRKLLEGSMCEVVSFGDYFQEDVLFSLVVENAPVV